MSADNKKYFLKFWFPVIIYAVLIFCGSSLQVPFAADFEIIGLDKVLHILEYTVLGFLLARAVAVSLPGIQPLKLVFIIFIIGTFYGFTDELHQYFISERNADILDLMADAVGSFLGALAWLKSHPSEVCYTTKKKVKNLETVVSPPYDVISHSMRDNLYKLSQYNVVRIILGKELAGDAKSDNKYTRAAQFIDEWLKKDILKKDKKPAIYIYEQKYLHKGKPKSRIGFISLMKIEDPKANLVLPHEYTFSKPKEDRLNLIRAANANTEPIFCIFEDRGGVANDAIRAYSKKKSPIIDIPFEGVENKIWSLTNPKIIKKITAALDKKQVFIADGHHRYEVSLAFRDEMRKKLGTKQAKKFENIMVYFSALLDDNLTILSTYRVIKNLGGMDWRNIESKLQPYFEIETVQTKEAMFDKLEAVRSSYAFGIYFKDGNFYVLRLKDESVLNDVIKEDKSREWKRLNVTVLHFLILGHILHVDKFSSNDENILYTRDEDDAIHQVKSGECEIAFFQLPTKMSHVRDIAKNGDRMPHKSTYFYPKPLSGLVMNRF